MKLQFLKKYITYTSILFLSILLLSCTNGTSNGSFIPPKPIESGFMLVGEGGIINKLSSTGQISNVRPSIEGMRQVVYGNNKFVAVGMFGIIISSTDGINWRAESTRASMEIYTVSFGNNKFIATGRSYDGNDYNIILYSNDGISWDIESYVAPSGEEIDSVAYGNSKFVATLENYWGPEGIKIGTSVDGVNWNFESIGVSGQLNNIVFDQNRFIAVGEDENNNSLILTSTDGKSWDRILNEQTNTTLNSITYLESKFIAVGQNESSQSSVIAISGDGLNWHFVDTNLKMPFSQITYGNGLFTILSNVESNNQILASNDLLNWVVESSISNAYLGGIAYGAGKFVISGSSPTAIGIILTSTDVQHWQDGFYNRGIEDLDGIIHANNQFIAVGYNGEILRSLDGYSWESKFNLPGANLYSIAYGNNKFITVGDNGVILSSTNGEKWTFESSGVKNDIYGITYGNNQFVAVGAKGTILFSGDGNNWLVKSSGINTNLRSVVYGGNKFVAVGESSNNILIAESTATTWVKESYPGGGNLFGVAYGNNQYVAFGSDFGESQAITLNSRDGINWNRQPNNLSFGGAIAFNNGRFVVGGIDGVIITSTDGVNWSYLPSFNGVNLYGICPF